MILRLALATAFTAVLFVASQASALTTFTMLDSDQVVPAPIIASDAAAMSLGYMNLSDDRLMFAVSWHDLTSAATSVAIHGPADYGEVGPALWSADVDPGRTNADGSGSFATLWANLEQGSVSDLLNGLWYMQVATELNPTGELRGQIVTAGYALDLQQAGEPSAQATSAPVPEPSAALVFAAGLGIVGAALRRRT